MGLLDSVLGSMLRGAGQQQAGGAGALIQIVAGMLANSGQGGATPRRSPQHAALSPLPSPRGARCRQRRSRHRSRLWLLMRERGAA